MTGRTPLPVGAIPPYMVRLRRKESFWTSVCVWRARQRTPNTHTCLTTRGRRRRPTCTEILPPLSLQSAHGKLISKCLSRGKKLTARHASGPYVCERKWLVLAAPGPTTSAHNKREETQGPL